MSTLERDKYSIVNGVLYREGIPVFGATVVNASPLAAQTADDYHPGLVIRYNGNMHPTQPLNPSTGSS